jgi:hypothetical protein
MSLESQEAAPSPRALQERSMSPASTPAPPSKSVTIEVELARLNQEVLNFKGCRVDKRNDAVLLRELKAKVKKNKAMLETLAVSAPILICLLSQACLFRIHASRILNPPRLSLRFMCSLIPCFSLICRLNMGAIYFHRLV